MKIFKSLKLKLSLWFVGAITLIIMVFSVALYLSMVKNLVGGLDSALETVAKKRQNDIMEGVEESENRRIDEEETEDLRELDEMKDIFPLFYIQLLELFDDGTRLDINIVLKSNNLGENTLPFPPFREGETKHAVFRDVSDERLSEMPLRMISFPFEIDTHTYYVLQFATTRKDVDETLNMLLMVFLNGDPILLVVSFFGGYFLVNRTLSPVRTVVASAKKITAEDLSLRLPSVGSKDEIGELVDTFNGMIARLDGSFRKIKQFSSDVSHEFKSPLTIIRGEIDVALRKSRLKQDYIDTLGSVGEEVEALQRIIDNLLFLAGTEAEGEQLPFETVALHKIVLEVFEIIQKMAKEKNIGFVLKEIQTIDIQGEASLLKRVFFNLFENAVKYSDNGGKVEILLENESNTAVFSIKDTGIGIPGNEIPFIFDRFYRVDRARSRRMGSAGLGLSIAKRIVRLHNGKIDVTSTPGEGSTFVVSLPIKN